MRNNRERTQRYAHMVERQTGKSVRPYREDGYVNMLNKYGTQQDTTEQYHYDIEPTVPDDLLERFYEGNGLFAKIIDTPAEEAVKHGFELDGVKDDDLVNFYMDALDTLDWEEVAMTCIKWARVFGGSIAVLLVDDGRGLDEPLDWSHIKSIDDIRVFDRSVIQPDWATMYHYDPKEEFDNRGSRLGMPERYTITDKHCTFTVHDSRCLVFQNGRLPSHSTNSIYELWGVPEYVRINRAIRDSEIAHGSSVKMLDRSVQAIYKMKDLAMELSTEDGEDRVMRRLETIDMARGLLNSITIDSEGEDYEFRTFSYSGVSEVIDSTCNYLSALTSIPQSILFGRSPAGMDATGHSDLENYYNFVERIQKRMLKKNLRYLLNIIFHAGVANKEIDEVPPIKVKFSPLWSMSDVEQVQLEQQKAQVQLTKANIAQAYIGMEVLDPSEVRKKLADTEEFDIDTILDDYTEEELMENAPSQQNQGGMPGMEGMGGGMPGMPGMGEMPQGVSQGAPEGAPQGMPMGMLQENPEEHPTDAVSGTPKAMRTSESEKRAEIPREKKQVEPDKEDSGEDDNKPNSVGIICVKDGKILCGKRHNCSDYGKYCGPGGHIDGNETPEEAAKRETEEEFGIKPLSLIPIGINKMQEDGNRPFVFLCTDWIGEPVSTDTEMVNPQFLSIEEIRAIGDDLFQPFIDGINLMEKTFETSKPISAKEVKDVDSLRKFILQFK